ncbi:MAG: chloride channel protein, partial [Anaerolineae bacterium]
LIGLLGLYFPQIFGVGYEVIENALLGQIAIPLLIALIFLKILATSLVLGSGGSGGVFAPSLFMGSMLGGVFGKVVHSWLPSATASPGAYALVGMAAVFAGAARAPITSILILFEMTSDYRIILPLMMTTVISTVLAERLYEESIYTLKLVRRGIRLQRGRDIDVMQGVLVKEAMTTSPDTIPWDMTLDELGHEFQRTHHHGFPVLDVEGKLYGVVTIQDLERALRRGKEANNLKAGDIATTSLLTVYPDEPLWAALKRLGVRDVGRLPVVDRRDPKKLLGMVRRSDIIRAYNLAIIRRQELQHRMDRLRLGRVTGVEFVEVEVGPDSPAVGKQIKDLPLPEDCIIVSVRRNRQILIPHGDTTIEVGDKVVAFAASESLPQVWEELTGKSKG